jgi:hypothetical protein
MMCPDLVDTFAVVIRPLALGEGRRIFDNTSPVRKLRPDSSTVIGTGVLIATFWLAL